MSTERKGRALASVESWRGQFGRCGCSQWRDVCNCGMSDLSPIAQDLPVNRWTVLAAVVIVALASFVSSLFPMGFAS